MQFVGHNWEYNLKLYGQRKMHMRVFGHGHWCQVCKPKIDKKTGRRKAREAGKREAIYYEKDESGNMDN